LALTKGAGSGACAGGDTTDGDEVQIQPMGPGRAPKRRKISQAELSVLAKGGKLKDDEVYVGRGGRGARLCPWPRA
jgi:hypothetical protein